MEKLIRSKGFPEFGEWDEDDFIREFELYLDYTHQINLSNLKKKEVLLYWNKFIRSLECMC